MEDQHYANLTINAPKVWLVRQQVRQLLGKVFYRTPALAYLLKGVGNRLVFLGKHLPAEEKNRLYYLALLKQDGADAHKFDSPYGYNDDLHELAVAIQYHDQLKRNDFETMPSESADLYKYVIAKLTELFQSDKNITSFLDFGVSYAYMESVLAKKYPHIQFIGIDRSKFTKFFNDEQFSHLKNLESVAGDIFEFLRSRRFDGGIFFHARTMLILPPSFIKKLYQAVREAGFRYIVGMEQSGISRDTWKPYKLSEKEQSSQLYRHFMYIHNYPWFLKNAGFTPIKAEFFKTHHPHPDYRILSFVSKRV